MNNTTTGRATNCRVGTGTILAGDVVRTGWGTLNIIDRKVTEVERWWHNGYENANLTFADGSTETMWAAPTGPQSATEVAGPFGPHVFKGAE